MTHAHTVTDQSLLTSAARTTSGQSNTFRVDAFEKGIIWLVITAISGTGTKLTLYPQFSRDQSDYASRLTAKIEATETGIFEMPIENFGKYMRVVYVIEGVDTSVTFASNFEGKD